MSGVKGEWRGGGERSHPSPPFSLLLFWLLVFAFAPARISERKQKNTTQARTRVVFPLTTTSDWLIISPYSVTLESNIMVVRIKKMITNLEAPDCQTNSPCKYQGKCKAKGEENIDINVKG